MHQNELPDLAPSPVTSRGPLGSFSLETPEGQSPDVVTMAIRSRLPGVLESLKAYYYHGGDPRISLATHYGARLHDL
jgi:hypothetical protein